MAKALMGHVNSDVRTTAVLAVENQRLRRRVEDLEALVLRLQAENDRLARPLATSDGLATTRPRRPRTCCPPERSRRRLALVTLRDGRSVGSRACEPPRRDRLPGTARHRASAGCVGSSWVTNIGDGMLDGRRAAAGRLADPQPGPGRLAAMLALQAAVAALRAASPGAMADRLDRRRVIMVTANARARRRPRACCAPSIATGHVNIAHRAGRDVRARDGPRSSPTPRPSTLTPMLVDKRRPRHRQLPDAWPG